MQWIRNAAIPAASAPAVRFALGGAPLDLIKLAAAAFMLGDHWNSILLGGAEPLLWRLGRIAFPLFCFVTAWHLRGGAEPGRYLRVMLVFAIATQPIFAIAFQNQLGNILFTLAAGGALAATLPRWPALARHLLFAAGVGIAVKWPFPAYTGVDFGLLGMLVPGAMLLVLRRDWSALPWLAALLLFLNSSAARVGESWLAGTATDAAYATVGGGAVIALSLCLVGLPRFLPRYVLHVFYPAHLAALAACRALS